MRPTRVPSPRAASVGGLGALVGLVVLEGAWLAGQGRLHGWAAWASSGAAVVAWAALVAAEHRRPRLEGRWVLIATAALALVAVAVAPFGSRDLYEYAMYGRMVVHHHANPYLVAPSGVGHDALLSHLAPIWRHSRSVYGPVFTAWSSLGALGFGHSALLARLFFQVSAGGALVGAVAYLWRRGASGAALVATGLSPVLVATVNGGHNDLLAGVAILVGVDLVRGGRPMPGGIALAVACGVKLSVLPVVAAVAFVLVARRGWASLARLTAGFVPPIVGAYLVVGGVRALAPLAGLAHSRSRASAWTAATALAPRLDLPTLARRELPTLSGATIVLLGAVAVVIAGRRGRLDPATLGVTLAVVAIFGSAYVLPWYPAVVLPLAGLCLESVASRVAHVGGVVLLLAYAVPPGRVDLALPGFVDAGRACGVALAVLAVVAALAGGFAQRAGDAT